VEESVSGAVVLQGGKLMRRLQGRTALDTWTTREQQTASLTRDSEHGCFQYSSSQLDPLKLAV
jgi:hypothetical protein